jgi:hypothetical protein
MENFNENPITEEVIVETPVVVEAPVVEAPSVVDTPVESVKEEAPVEEAKVEEPKPADVIAAPSYAGQDEVPALGSVENGAIGATTAPRTPKKKIEKPTKEDKTVAIKSTKNVSWSEVGKVSRGINIVSEKDAKQWLTRDHISLVSPEDVAKEFGK